MLTTSKQKIVQVYECVKKFHSLETFPTDIPDPQHESLLPSLRPYQVRAVKWMLSKELHPSHYFSDTTDSASCSTEQKGVLLPKGGILAEEMGLGKTVEVLACMLSNPRKIDECSEIWSPEEVKQENDTVELVKIKSDTEIAPIEDFTVEVGFQDHKESKKEVEPEVIEVLDDSEVVLNEETQVKELRKVRKAPKRPSSKKPKRKAKKRKTTFVDDESDEEFFRQIGVDDESSLVPVKIESSRKRKVESENVEPVLVETNPSPNESRPRSKRKRNVVNYSDPVFLEDDGKKQKSKKASTVKAGERYALLKSWYEDCLSESSALRSRSRPKQPEYESTFQCCCVSDVVSDRILECPKCKTWQHAECVNYDKSSADFPYYCFRCFKTLPPVKSVGTVIISPESISQQWVSEIDKHVRKDKLNVLVYEGVRVNGYIQPHDLAKYDVVITSYEVLSKELNYTEPVSRSLRHAKRFFAPTSPLLFVEWWRLCLDEAQMVEGSTCRAAEMAKKFSAVNKWAVTGTPIQKAVNDLVGLMEFLAGDQHPEFLALTKDWRSLLRLVPRVLWRTQMKDVLAETGVPPQTVETHMLTFAKIEKYFYQCTHTECSQQFIYRINRYEDLNVTLRSLDRKGITNLLQPLLKLRQACLHPQAVRGKFMSVKKTMTMEDLVGQMVTSARLDAEQALRQLVSTLNGAGALHIIRCEWSEAVNAYRTVLHLEQEHKDKLKVDSLQRIHAMFNLAEVLDGNREGIPPTLRDGSLRDDIKVLERRYLGKREAPVLVTEERVIQHAEAIKEQSEGKEMSSFDWWEFLLEWSNDRDELLDRLKSSIQQTDDRQKNQYNNLNKKLNSLYVVKMEIGKWLEDVSETRNKVQKWISELKQADQDEMAEQALRCHLPQAQQTKFKRTKCKLCLAEADLKQYEALLFEEKSKEKRKKRNSDVGSRELDNREVADLVDVNVNTFESSKKGGFKASPYEKILRALVSYGKQKQAPSEWNKLATHHLNLMDRVKKEFLDLNLMWRQMCDLVDAKDELNMCKIRLRLPLPGEEDEPQGSSKRKKKKLNDAGESRHIIAPYKVEPELLKNLSEKEQFEVMLKKKIGTLCYLENLQKEGGSAAICPICRNDFVDKWSVLQCGHSVCLECLSVMMKPQSAAVPCPQCRQPCDLREVSYVQSQATDTPAPLSDIDVQGNLSTKVDAVVRQTLVLKRDEADVKILVFSAWEKVLDLLSEAFEKNNISFRRMKSNKQQRRQVIKDFKTCSVTVLLLPLRSGAKGLNLVEATHVFLVEPILNPAEELQAVGRVHRIGQTKATVVHRFIVQETIEERILAAVAASAAEQWSDDCVTLQQLYDLFSTAGDLSLSATQATIDIDSNSEPESENEDESAIETLFLPPGDSSDDDL